jgi:hypothetical protein
MTENGRKMAEKWPKKPLKMRFFSGEKHGISLSGAKTKFGEKGYFVAKIAGKSEIFAKNPQKMDFGAEKITENG